MMKPLLCKNTPQKPLHPFYFLPPIHFSFVHSKQKKKNKKQKKNPPPPWGLSIHLIDWLIDSCTCMSPALGWPMRETMELFSQGKKNPLEVNKPCCAAETPWAVLCPAEQRTHGLVLSACMLSTGRERFYHCSFRPWELRQQAQFHQPRFGRWPPVVLKSVVPGSF